ncbi:hypothetical protein AXE65_09435 [Ventosimonas gracilis]|uniref:Uncharacterized protein n=1 Tax=Ventosimonas gracilis TaxID=1680762 RepID=A0A139SXG1_9GAMM|nr:hypothetical protein [Ventosimonas gracilis]KXU39286.1 hypothetical protein AXE65_09435 [Ventosimonas gracilis]
MTTRTRQLTRELASERVMILLEKKKISLTHKLLVTLALGALTALTVFVLLDKKPALAAWLPQQPVLQSTLPAGAHEQQWRAELENLNIKYQVELASRQALEQQVLALDTQIKEMQTELDFFRSNNGGNGGATNGQAGTGAKR